MFGFGKKKEPSPQKANRARRSEDFEERKAQSRAQLGFLVGLDDDTGTSGGAGSFDIDDTDLENELLQLIGGDSPPKSRPSKAPSAPARGGGGTGGGQKAKPTSAGFESLSFDLNLEDEGHQHEDDDDLDLDDPDLQAELGEILGDPVSPIPTSLSEDEAPTPAVAPPTMSKDELVKLLQDRLDLYEKAKANADKVGDSGKSRRFTRGVKTLKELLSKAKSGRNVDESEIPPVVSLGIAAGVSTLPISVPLSPPADFPVPVHLPKPADPQTNSNRDILSPSPQLNLPEPLKPVQVSQPQPPPPEPKVDYGPVVPPPRKKLPEPPVDYEPPPPLPARPEPLVDYEKTPIPQPPEVEQRLKDYKRMAIILKRDQDTQGALHYLKLSKVLGAAMISEDPVDLTQFPELPSSAYTDTDNTVGVLNASGASGPAQTRPESASVQSASDNPSEGIPQPQEDIFGAPPAPTSVMEALEQRLEKYKSEVEKANSTSNASKARRMGRIVKQYEEAIVAYKKGKPVPYDELPTPPGFAQIPLPGAAVGFGGGPQSVPEPVQVTVRPQPRPGPSGVAEGDDSATPEKRVKPSPPRAGVSPSSASSINRGSGKPVTKLTLQEKQLAMILQRQKQYRDGALEAKKRGDVNQAREYLRISKGFDNLIEASKSGLPVDLTTLPSPPEAIESLESEGFEVVGPADCIAATGDMAEVYAKLEEDLKQQLKMCMRTRDHFKSIGDVASANRFESMALDTKRDLDAIRMAAKTGQQLPKCNTDIKEDEMEITVVQGVNLKGSSSLDTFVRVELPYPSAEEAQSQKSHIVKDSTDPVYNVTYKMNINRTARNFQRFTHRHGVKFEVWSKGGFLRSSTLLGTATAKLQPLENKCDLHDAFDILDGRKVVGKLEVKIRIREPVLTKQITQKKEKWLTIDRA